MTRRRAALACVAVAAVGVLAACASILGIDSGEARGDGGAEGAAADATTPDSRQAPDADGGPTVVYSDIADTSKWTTFNVTQVGGPAPGPGSPTGYYGAVFDGRFEYLVPAGFSAAPPPLLRYDTTVGFADAGSWVGSLLPSAAGSVGFIGGATDGRYVYCAPFNGPGGPQSNLLRTDTMSARLLDASIEAFPIAPLAPAAFGNKALGYYGSVYDGRYLYLVPNIDSTGLPNPVVARYDTSTGKIDAGSAYEFFDVSSTDPNATGFRGGVFDGKHVYFVTSGALNLNGMHRVARYDTTRNDFQGAGSWTSVNVRDVNNMLSAFSGGVFDGRYVYLPPSNGSLLVRHDTTQEVTVIAAWNVFDLTQINGGTQYNAAVFDGRFVWLVPGAGPHVIRFDTTKQFSDPASWQRFSLGDLDAGVVAFGGGGFDGKYVYFTPIGGGVAARFDARDVPTAAPVGGGAAP
jgi:hypothetical protein